jgi:hypothetical protein
LKRPSAWRSHASTPSHFTHHNIKEYSQWFPGKKNNIADSLSRDFDLDDAELSKYLHLHYPSQLPPHFQVVRIPSEIELWLISLLLRLPVKEQLRELHMTTRQEPIDDGTSTLSPSASGTTPSSTNTKPPHLRLRHSSSRRKIFKRCFRNPGCRNSQKYQFECMLDLQGARTPKPIKRRRPSILLPSTATVQIIRQRQPKTEVTKSHPHVRHRRDRKATKHRATASNQRAHHRGNFLCHAIVRVPQGHPSREATDRHPSPPQPQIFQGRETDRTR